VALPAELRLSRENGPCAEIAGIGEGAGTDLQRDGCELGRGPGGEIFAHDPHELIDVRRELDPAAPIRVADARGRFAAGARGVWSLHARVPTTRSASCPRRRSSFRRGARASCAPG